MLSSLRTAPLRVASNSKQSAAASYATAAPLRPREPAQISNKLALARAPQPTALPPGSKDHRAPGAERPHLGIRVRPDHGLWRFFRRVPDEDGAERHHAVEPSHMLHKSAVGRSWTAAELRRKSFKDLHTLWYIIARERNLLATQAEAMRRIRGNREPIDIFYTRELRCRKSHARIKFVLNERRLMYEGAAEVLKEEQEKAHAAASAQTQIAAERAELDKRPEWEKAVDALAEKGELSRVVRGRRARMVELKVARRKALLEKLEAQAAAVAEMEAAEAEAEAEEEEL